MGSLAAAVCCISSLWRCLQHPLRVLLQKWGLDYINRGTYSLHDNTPTRRPSICYLSSAKNSTELDHRCRLDITSFCLQNTCAADCSDKPWTLLHQIVDHILGRPGLNRRWRAKLANTHTKRAGTDDRWKANDIRACQDHSRSSGGRRLFEVAGWSCEQLKTSRS